MARHACPHVAQIQPVTPRTKGCEECLAAGDSWVHLRLCLTCGHVGCCDSSRNKHATKHFHQTGHPVMRSAEPGEDWGWCYIDQIELDFRPHSAERNPGAGRVTTPEATTMAEMLDCLVSYFSADTSADGMPHRYLAYQVVAGPGPHPESGIASITPLAAYDENHVCETCERVFAVKQGGAAAALEEALRYMDAYHEGDRLQKVQSEIRRLSARTSSANA